ncbi:MAG: response regulator transcription factor [Deltaproteobacteria bacterium]|nr:response regulator transcription factor [Deltaproteobacteria bacterium]
MPIKLLIGCKLNLFAEGLRHLLRECEDLNVVGVACSCYELEEMLHDKPDIFILDDFFFQSVLEKSLKIDNSPPKILLVTGKGDASFVFQDLQGMVARGLVGILTQDADSEHMKKAIHKVYAGDLWIAHDTIRNSLCSNYAKKKHILLTKREKEVLNCLSSGYTNKKIAQELFISEQTVKSHMNRLFKKFGVPNRLQLAISISNVNTMTFN